MKAGDLVKWMIDDVDYGAIGIVLSREGTHTVGMGVIINVLWHDGRTGYGLKEWKMKLIGEVDGN